MSKVNVKEVTFYSMREVEEEYPDVENDENFVFVVECKAYVEKEYTYYSKILGEYLISDCGLSDHIFNKTYI